MNTHNTNCRERIAMFLCVFALFINCACTYQDSRGNASEHLDSVALVFKTYIDSIPTLKLPLNFKCGLNGAAEPVEGFEEYRSLMPRDVQLILGRLATDRYDFHYIIYGAIGDDVYPILCSYTLDGKIIDSITLDSGCGGADETMSLTSYAEVRGDMTIALTDTIRSFHYPENSDTYVLDSVTIDRIVYKPGKDGHFVKD